MPPWFRPVIGVVNSFFQNVWNALNHDLSLQDNLRNQIIDIDYVGGSLINITTKLIQPLVGIVVLQAFGPGVTGGVFVVWTQIGKVITVSQITGLTSGNEYKLRLLLV